MERQAVVKAQKSASRSKPLQRQSAGPSSAGHPLLELQRSIGNQAVQRLIRSPYIQAKLQVSTPGDPYEQEADRVADTVMRMPDSEATAGETTRIQAKPLATRMPGLLLQEEEEEKTVATKLATDAPLQRQARGDDEREEEALQTSPIQRQTEEGEEEKVQTKSLSSQLSPSLRVHSVHRSASAVIQRLCTECEEEKQQDQGQSGGMVHRKSTPERLPDDDDVEEQQVQSKEAQTAAPKVTTSVAANIHAMNGGGSPLSNTTRAFFEPRFGADLRNVRVHTDSRAAETAKSINARAFTVGKDIAFGAGHYEPDSQGGQRLLAHELTHVVQQDGKQLQRVQMQAKEGAATGGAPSGREKGPLNFPSTAVSGGRGLTSAPPIVHEVLRSPGQHLDAATRAFFEPRFGSDFGDIRVHTDSTASKSAAAVNARAYTAGKNIVFAAGQYAPHSHAGQRLLAHELVHTVQQHNGVVSPSSIQREPAGGCGLCYGEGPGKVGARDAGTAAHKAIQNELDPRGISAELPWGNGRVDLAVVRDDLKQIAIAEIKPANKQGVDDGIKQIEERLRVLPKLKKYAKYKWVPLNEPVDKRIRFATEAPVCTPPYAVQPGYCFSQHLSVAGPVKGLLYLYFCEPSYSELLTGGCTCECKEPKDKKPKDKEPKDKEPGPSDSLPEQLLKLGKELVPLLARAGLLDIGLALARGMLAFVAGPLAALAAVVLGIVFFWDEIKSVASKIASVLQAVWDKIAGLAEFVRGVFTTILGKLRELGIKLVEVGRFVAGKIASLAKKLAEGALWVAGRIWAGAKWVGRKIASGAEAFWDWLWGSDVQPIYPVIDIPITEEPTQHCATVAYEDTVVRLDTDLLFPTSGRELTEKADALLKDAARRIGSMLQKDDWIKFEGYADIIPKRDATPAESDKYNQWLSEQRAEAVRSWFVAHGVVPMARTRIEGYGKTMAKAKANDEEGRKKDRRVDIWLPKRGGTKKVCW